jgi:hypothetical protein
LSGWLASRTLRRQACAGGAGALLALGAAAAALAYLSGGHALAHASAPGRASCQPEVLNRSSVLAGRDISVSPLPGSMDASPDTQISLLGQPAHDLSDVSVSGSRSGNHPGTLRAYSQGDGASFVPSTGFRVGEQVTVRGHVFEQGSSRPFAYEFTISDPDPIPTVASGPPPLASPGQIESFKSEPGLHPPSIKVTTDSSKVAPGYVFTAPYSGPSQDGPLIFDNAGNTVWFDPTPFGTKATNLQVQTYQGQRVLTWWQGYIPPQGFGEGEEMIANGSYQVIARVHAGNGLKADLHDFVLAPNDTALLTVVNPIHCDLAAVGGPRDGAIYDDVFEELDLKTGLVRREWHSLDHVSTSLSYASDHYAPALWPWDYFHLNSIALQSNGGILISSRSTWTLYEVDRGTGQITARIGGKDSSFTMGPSTSTAWQHDANQLANGDLTVFDNGAVPAVHSQSRGLVEKLDLAAKTVTLVAQYEHPPPLSAGSQGNFQVLGNGDVFLGWGAQPYVSEFSTAGTLLFDASMPTPTEAYRAYRFVWTGLPAAPPAVALRTSAGKVTAYVSWNGATQVVRWRVLGGSDPDALKTLASVAKNGFETSIALASHPRLVQLQALDSDGKVIGTSALTRPS